MAPSRLEVADIFRDHGPAWRDANRGHISLEQLKVMSAIERCRTAALGGHVARCENEGCAHTVISYNSCLIGKIGNGESKGCRRSIAEKFVLSAPHYALALSMAINLSGGRNAPLRRCGGTMASMASSFSLGSPRV